MKLEDIKKYKSLLTFVVIGKNEEKIINKCITSILNFNQEIIYIDSDSEDKSILKLQKFSDQVRIVDLKSTGYLHTASLARNIGGKLANGKFIQFLDADMTINLNWIVEAINFLNKNITYSAVVGFKKEYKSINSDDYKIKRDNFFFNYPDYLSGCFLIRRQDYLDVDGFDPCIFWDEERELYLRMLKKGFRLKYLDKYMADHYDYKTSKRSLLFYLVNEKHKCFWIMITKVFKTHNFKSYIIIYRHIFIILIFELISLYLLFLQDLISLLFAQLLGLIYAKMVNRRGIILYWKSIFLTSLYYLFKKNIKKFSFKILK